MRTLFLSHNPHESHLNFAKSINAEIKIAHFLYSYSQKSKSSSFLEYFYPLISLICSLFIRFDKDILLVDGGSSLYASVFLKLRRPQTKLIYLDGDLLFYNLSKRNNLVRNFIILFVRKIDGIISVSGENKNYALKFSKVPIEVCPPYPQEIKRDKTERCNYGLYVGRLDPDKNIKRIINFGLQCPYFEKFIVAGNGVLEDYVEKKAEKNKKLIYLGKINDVGRLYNKCKFLIHIPNSDPCPCATMEAAVCDCFPIISEGVGSKYLFDKKFIINNPDNFNEINEKIKYILDNEGKFRKILRKSIAKIPTKKKSIENFKIKFERMMEKTI